ncbi:MAG: SRPBCC family protein [Deltaproteobacteria bacterium]
MQEVEVKASINGRREEVWNLYTDHVSWQEWSKIGKVRLACEGQPAPNGVGCVRVISNGPISVEEKILSFDSPRRMTYTIVRGGLPIKDHLGEVVFSDEGETTLITWRCRFRSRIPGLGFLWKAIVNRVFTQTLDSLGRRFGQP